MYEEYIHARECLKEAKNCEGIEEKLDRYIDIYNTLSDKEQDVKGILFEHFRKIGRWDKFEVYIFHQRHNILLKYTSDLENEKMFGFTKN